MKGALGRLVVMIVAAGLVGAAIAFPLVGGAGVVAGQVADSAVGSTSDLESGVMPAATTVTDSAGTPIAHLFDQYRIPVPADRISPAMKAAIVAIEDRRFFEHGGFDPLGAARALVNNSNGGATQGASTLTEQYVKNYDLYVAARTEAERRAAVAPSYARKLKEAELAISLDHRVSKDDILADYLNIVYFGNGAYGVGAAAQAYFGTTADRLTVAQAALLAGMVQSPTEYDPIQHPEAATGRRNVVIEQLRQQARSTPARQRRRPPSRSASPRCPPRPRRAASARATPGSSAPTSCRTSRSRGSRRTSWSRAGSRSAPRSTAGRSTSSRPRSTGRCRRRSPTSPTSSP
ncbi:transglycosylase domain-containing protein [Pseudonocardia benzenivorans]